MRAARIRLMDSTAHQSQLLLQARTCPPEQPDTASDSRLTDPTHSSRQHGSKRWSGIPSLPGPPPGYRATCRYRPRWATVGCDEVASAAGGRREG
jgi:hypothetical protein